MALLESILGGGLKDLVLGVMDRIKLNPEKRAEVELAMAQNAHELAKMQAEYETKLLEVQQTELKTASANIIAEVGTGDKYTARARPTFMYMINAILAWNYIAVPLFHHDPVPLPEPLFWLFGSAILGYTGARTWEKIGVARAEGAKK